MSAPTDPRTLVLHGLRLKGFAEAAVVADTVAIDEDEAKVLLERLADEGLVTYRSGRLSGFTLTPTGRHDHSRLLSEELDAHGVRARIEGTYRRFLRHNADLLSVCTAWQLREIDGESVLNDHQDAAYDAAVIDQLSAIHHHIEPVCSDLADTLARYRTYGPRLGSAFDQVRAGAVEWFTKPMIASYHTVWFELHEDLLATLGIERGSEEAAS